MAGRTGVTGDQVEDESLTGEDILNSSVKAVDVDLPDVASGIANDPAASASIIDLINFGKDKAVDLQLGLLTISGGSFVPYSLLNFDVSDTSGINEYRLNIDFLWGHNSASNDARFRMYLDGSQVGEELRIEPKDAGTDQRFQNNILFFANNLSQGSHTLELRARPSSGNRQTRLYRAYSEVWRTE